MTYPQQRGQHGGFQQPGQYGGYQQPGPGQYGQFGGYGRPPQRKSNAAVIVVLVVVLVLAGLGITGFVAPGFFLGDDKESAGGSGIDQFAGTLVEAANDQDKSALGDLKCADATDSVDEAITLIGQTGGAELSGTKEIAKDKYVVVVTISYQGTNAPFAATVVKNGNDLCWQDFAPGSGPAGGGDSVPGAPSPGGSDEDDDGSDKGPGEGEAFVEEFLNAVNAKDAAKAEGMYCSDAPSNPLVDYVIGKNPKLTLGEVDRPGSSLVSYLLDGTLDGEPLNQGRVSVRISGRDSPCVFTFNAG